MKQRRDFSIKWRILSYLFVLLFLLMLIVGATFILKIVDTQNQLRNSRENTLQLVVALLEQKTEELEQNVYSLSVHNASFSAMAGSQSDLSLYAETYDVLEALDPLLNAYDGLTFALLYSRSNDACFLIDNGLVYLPPKQQASLRREVQREFVRQLYMQALPARSWFTLVVDGRSLLCRMVDRQDVYCMIAFDLERLSAVLNRDYGFDGSRFVIRDGGTLLSGTDEVLTDVPWQGDSFLLRDAKEKPYMVASQPLCGLTVSYLYPLSGLGFSLDWSAVLLLLILTVLVVLLPLAYFRLKRNFFSPLDRLVETMDAIEAGNTEARADDHFASTEFRQINQTFNQMLGQITSLRIDQYEREIEARQAKLQYLQAQIRPHFYLNCLKSLYALSEQNKDSDVGNGILLISNHLRYAFQQSEDTVPLSEELRLCDNYVKLHNTLSSADVRLSIDIDATAFDTPIPPVSLLTFVENSLRYALTSGQTLEMTITARRLQTEDGQMLWITVKDNGVGFTQAQLSAFNSKDWFENTTEHIGIQNVIRRFKLIYGDGFAFAFSNRGGAVQEMYMPLKACEKEDGDEAADR